MAENNHTLSSPLDSVRIIAAPEHDPLLETQAWVLEEDTFLVLSPPPATIKIPSESMVQIMIEAIDSLPVLPGSIVVKKGYPLRLLAVVHDLNHEPTWRVEWIGTAYQKLFKECDERRIHTVALPLLGTVHGSLDENIASELLLHSLRQASPLYLRTLQLIKPGKKEDQVYTME
ncbi:hypothetical protein ACFL27_01830 [candidate division CSSED10-310 bacterium]|uniref:Macro domain-containing protein n=1 Tax=candidate division CSSED10-310 bacterium TaxID=2855610 RepID=A0ABV6YS73_UNCC1